jgi:hypothetical protein
MALHGVFTKEKVSFIHPSDTGHPDHPDYKAAVEAGRMPDKPTVFYIGNLTYNDKIEMTDMVQNAKLVDGVATLIPQPTARAYEVVRRGLKGWDNYIGENGVPIKYATETVPNGDGTFSVSVSRDCITAMPISLIMDLSTEIMVKNGMVASPLKPKEDTEQVTAPASQNESNTQ